MERHFNTKHTQFASKYPIGDTRKKAVEELKQMDINPNYVRSRTIQIMKEHRLVFINLIQDIFDEEDVKRDFMKEWPKVFTHKLGLRTSLPYEIAKHRSLTEDSWNSFNRKRLIA